MHAIKIMDLLLEIWQLGLLIASDCIQFMYYRAFLMVSTPVRRLGTFFQAKK